MFNWVVSTLHTRWNHWQLPSWSLVFALIRNHYSRLWAWRTRAWSSNFPMVTFRGVLHVVTFDVLILVFVPPIVFAFFFIFQPIKTPRIFTSPFIVIALSPWLSLGLIWTAILISKITGMPIGPNRIVLSHIDLPIRHNPLLRFLHVLGVLRPHARQFALRVVDRAVLRLPPWVSRFGRLRLHWASTRFLILVDLSLVLLHVLILFVLLNQLLARSVSSEIRFFRILVGWVLANVGVGWVLSTMVKRVFWRFRLFGSKCLMSLIIELVLVRRHWTNDRWICWANHNHITNILNLNIIWISEMSLLIYYNDFLLLLLRRSIRQTGALLITRLISILNTLAVGVVRGIHLFRLINVIVVAATTIYIVLSHGNIFAWVNFIGMFADDWIGELVMIQASEILLICFWNFSSISQVHACSRWRFRTTLLLIINSCATFMHLLLLNDLFLPFWNHLLVLPIRDSNLLIQRSPSLLLESLLDLLRLELNLRSLNSIAILVLVGISVLDRILVSWLLVWFELHEGIRVWPELANHVFLKQQVVSCCQMVVLVILYWFEQALSIEALLCFEVTDDLLI